ncbi:MAG TPA: hypothetical protein VIK11_03795 [Tepidiformaceae bacterium]|jgi:hypothetical protein
MTTREQKVNRILARGAEDERRLGLNELDRVARETSTFGSDQHRTGRDTVERAYDEARRNLEQLSDQQLDDRLA